MPDVPRSYPDPGDGLSPEQDRGARLVVVRHGTTTWSRAGRHTGRTDVPLAEDGRREALGIGLRLRGHRFALVLTSPLSRARETCALAGFGEQAQVDADLAEWDYGQYEGLTTAQIRSDRPGWSLWRDGVPAGESLGALSGRADRLVALARSAVGDVLAFGHGHILRVVCARWVGLAAQEASRFFLAAGSLGVLGWERELPVVMRWNDAGGDPLA